MSVKEETREKEQRKIDKRNGHKHNFLIRNENSDNCSQAVCVKINQDLNQKMNEESVSMFSTKINTPVSNDSQKKRNHNSRGNFSK